MGDPQNTPGVRSEPQTAPSSTASTLNLRKANSKFKPATGPATPATGSGQTTIHNRATLGTGLAVFSTPGFGKRPSSSASTPISAPPFRREVIDLASEPSLSDITGSVPSKRSYCDSGITQGSSIKRIRSFPPIGKNDAFRMDSSAGNSRATYMPPEPKSKENVSRDDTQRSAQLRSSNLDAKALESLRLLLSRTAEYRQLVAVFIGKHLDGIEEHDFIMLGQIMDFIDDRKRAIGTQITHLEYNEQETSFRRAKLGTPVSTFWPSNDFRDLATKPLELLRFLLSRSHQYKRMFSPIARKHVTQSEEHDLKLLSQIIDHIDSRMHAIRKQIAIIEGVELRLLSLTNETRRSALPPEFPQIGIDNEPSPPPPPPPLSLSAENSISSAASIAHSTSTEVSVVPSAISDDTLVAPNSPLIVQDDMLADPVTSADGLTLHDSDDKLWNALDDDTPDTLMDPPSEATHEPVRATGSTSTPSVRRRVDHTASSYYPEIISILKGTFKLSHFRKNQLECITATLDGKDVFYLAPTGGGKSLCYQLPALCSTGKTQGTTFVISPLLSLIEDQVSTLRKKGINAFRLINTVDADQANDAMPRLRKGESLPLVYTTPEKLLGSNNVQDIVVQLYNQKQLARFVVDEAHVIGGWRVWRESYASLGILRKQWPDIPIMALTGSANMSAIEDIKESLALRNPVCLKQSFNRSNLYYKVKKKPSQKKELLKEIAGFIQSHHKDDTGIIYCLSRDDCEDVARRLREEFNLSARHFHAGMDRDSKRINQEDWSNGKCKIIVATIAFGMGIDKPDVRFVIHATMSKDMDGYYQETGRAGRDGEPSDCVLFYAYSDAMKIQNMLKNPHDQNNKPPPDEIQRQLERLSAVVAYASNEGDCRRVAILRHFDEEFDEAECHKSCDNCCKPGTVVNEDHTETAQQAVQLLRDMSNCSRERGIALTMFKDVWRGKKGATVSAYTGLPGYAAASKLDHRMIDRIVTQLLYSNIFTTRRTTSGNGFGNNYLELGSNAENCRNGLTPFLVSYKKTDDIQPKSSKQQWTLAKKPRSSTGKVMVVIQEPKINKNQYQSDIDDISQASDDDVIQEADDFGASSSRIVGRPPSTRTNKEGMGMLPTIDTDSLLAQLTSMRHQLAQSIGVEDHGILLDETLQSIAHLCPTDQEILCDIMGNLENQDDADEKCTLWSPYFLRVCQASSASIGSSKAFNSAKMYQNFAFQG